MKRHIALAFTAVLASAAPAAAAPRHVATMAFYQGVDENTDLSVKLMAATYDWTQQSVFGGKTAAAFVAAGGKHAVVYTDPFVIFRCASAAAGSCRDAEEFKNGLRSDALLHDASGAIVYSDARHEQRVNYSSPSFLSGFEAELRSLVAQSQGAWGRERGGYVELDDLGNKNTVHAWTSVWPAAAGVSSDAQIVAAKTTVVRKAAAISNVLLNGVNYDWPENYAALFDAVGHDAKAFFNENCFATDYGQGYLTATAPATDAWLRQERGILGVTSRGYTDICWGKGDPAPVHRLYYLGSFWMTYDAARSVAFEEMCAPDPTPKGHCNTTWDDGAVVPEAPLQTASGDSLDALHNGDATYAREFERCYDDGRPIGRCAAIVNPSDGAAPLPRLRAIYGRSLRLSVRSLAGGAHHEWVSGTPAALAPHAGAILAP